MQAEMQQLRKMQQQQAAAMREMWMQTQGRSSLGSETECPITYLNPLGIQRGMSDGSRESLYPSFQR